MPEEFIESKDGLKIRKLTELKTNTAKEYEEAINNNPKDIYFRSSPCTNLYLVPKSAKSDAIRLVIISTL